MEIHGSFGRDLTSLPVGAPALAGPEGALATAGALEVTIVGAPFWNDPELAARARAAGPAAAFLLAAQRHGADAFAHTDGAFAAAILDRDAPALHIAIDRAGQHRLCHARTQGGGFAFASTAASLAEMSGVADDIDPLALQDYLHFYCIPAPRTVWRAVRKLLPAECLTFRDGEVKSRLYWRMPYGEAARTDLAPGVWQERLRSGLEAAMDRTLATCGEAGVGSFLSGGLDSSTLTGLLARRRPGTKSFTIRFHDPRYDEGEFARIAAAAFPTDHRERHVVPEDVVAIMQRVAACTDEPYGNTSAIAAFHCAAAARDAGISVMIAGDGGDEIFAGNERYVSLARYDVYGRVPAPLRRFLLDPLLAPRLLDRLPVLGKAHRLMRRYHMTLPERMFADYHPFRHFSREQVFGPALLETAAAYDPLKLAGDAFAAPDEGDSLQRMMALDLRLIIADNDLVKVNSMCGLAGVGVRYPMLDRELMEMAAAIPSDIMMPGKRLRGLFKDSFSGFLPQAIIDKTKQGFGLPFREWVGEHGGLREIVLDALSGLAARPLFSRRYIEALQQSCREEDRQHLRGNAWDAAMLELWLRSHKASL